MIIEPLDLLRSNLSRIRIPEPTNRIFKHQCCVSYDTPRSDGGLFIDLYTFLAFGKDYVGWNYEKTGNPVYLHIKQTKKLVLEDRPSKKPTLLAIGINGGFENDEPEYEETHSIVILPEYVSLSFPSVELPEKVRLAVDEILLADGAERMEQLAAWAADEKQVSAYAMNLQQIDNGVVIPPSGWKCAKCDKKDNLWLNLTDGMILCGRKNWDGSGGNNHAIEHYEQTRHPLAVKLGTITADLEAADVYSYPEDNSVLDPHLAQHLAFFGIDFSSLQKTEMTTAERELDQNTNFDWNRIQESGQEVEPIFGPGYTGLVNIGNSCYMAATMQAVFSTRSFISRYYSNQSLKKAFELSPADPTVDLNMQLTKLAHGLLSGKYSVPEFKNDEKENLATSTTTAKQEGIRPNMFKAVIAASHPEFSSIRQQDALEFFLHFLDRVEQANAGKTELNPANSFKFGIEDRISCSSGKVTYNRRHDYILSLNIPLHEATNKETSEELESFHKLKADKLAEGKDLSGDEIVRPRVPLEACLANFSAPEDIHDFYSTALKRKTTALKTAGLTSFPDYLVLHMRRFVMEAGWVPKKLDVYIDVPDIIDISHMRSKGRQDGEELLPDGGSIPMEIGHLNQLQNFQLANNKLSGPIPSKILNISTLESLDLEQNSLSGMLPSNMGSGLPNLQFLYLSRNNFVGNIPESISNATNLVRLGLDENEFSGVIPNSFGDLAFIKYLFIDNNNLTLNDDSLEINFLTSLTSCRYLVDLDVSGNRLSKLPKTIGNLSVQQFWANSCGINGNIPLEIGNMSNLIGLYLSRNDLNGPIPSTIKRSPKLQSLNLDYNGLQGSIVHELCEIRSLSELNLTNNKFFGELPTCLGNMTSLRKFYIGSNRLTSKIPSSFWNLKDILEVSLSSNDLIGNLPPDIQNLKALVKLDLSRNKISSNIPTAISFLINLETLSLEYNKLEGPIPTSLGEMLSLSFLDLSQNLIAGVIPKSLESLSSLKYINLSYNRLQGEIPDAGPFKSFTAQSFMHNEALCGNPRLQVHPCDKQIRKKSKKKMLLIICITSTIVVLGILVIACIILERHKRKKVENPLKSDLSATLGVPRRISYYELVKATNGFSESNLLGKGGFGSVYHGILSSGKMVAIKVLDLTLEATSRSFDAECNAMRNLRHRNLVQVISSCSNDDFKSLVMEFMSNGSVEKWLYSENYCLNFLQRLNIMIDVASALEYLHHGSSIPVVHCDLKPSNVLLDEDMVAHVSDFGISKLLDEGQSKTHTQTLATLGYVAPEYGSKGFISVKGDVYSYGIMLMEMFTGKKPTNEMFSEELTLKTWISESMVNSVMEVVDYNLVSQHEKELHEILALALSCCADSPEARIKMTDVTASLSKIKTLLLR